MVLENSILNILKSFVNSGLVPGPTDYFCVYYEARFTSINTDIFCGIHCSAHLNKQIQILGDYMARPTQDDERQRSHSMASTTAAEGHHPPMTPSTFVDNNRSQSQFYDTNGPWDGGSCYTPAPCPYMDSNIPLTSVQRDYTRRNIDISYTDGSGDKKWSSTDFPWTKELEVIFFFPNQLLITSLTLAYDSH